MNARIIAQEAVGLFLDVHGEYPGKDLAFDETRNQTAYDLAWDLWLDEKPGYPFEFVEDHVHICLLKGVPYGSGYT